MLLLALLLSAPAIAQTPPSPTEAAAYRGLHRAAHDGDAAAIRRLVAAGADVNARDTAGRTPAHAAAFASNDQALRALAAAGADMTRSTARPTTWSRSPPVADDPELLSLALELGNRADLVTSPGTGRR